MNCNAKNMEDNNSIPEKIGYKKQICFRVTTELYDRISASAHAVDMPVSDYCRQVMDDNAVKSTRP